MVQYGATNRLYPLNVIEPVLVGAFIKKKKILRRLGGNVTVRVAKN